MEQINLDHKSVFRNIFSLSAEELIDKLYSFNNEELDDEDAEILCGLLRREDKGTRNAAANLLISNPYVPIPDCLVKLTFSEEEISLRNLAGEILIKNGAKSVEVLLAHLDKGNDDDKKFIIDVLGLISDRRAVAKIVEILGVSKHPNVILACIEALGNIGEEIPAQKIIPFYTQNELYKPTIIEALGKIGSVEALSFIEEKYPQEDILTKYSMIESLGKIGNERTFEFLLGLPDKDDRVLLPPIIKSLNDLKNKYGFDFEIDEKLKDAVIESLKNGSIFEINSALELIDGKEASEFVSVCIDILGRYPENDERITALLLAHPEKTLEQTVKALDPYSGCRQKHMEIIYHLVINGNVDIENVLREKEKTGFLKTLTLLSDDPDEEIRKATMELIFYIDYQYGLDMLDKFLHEANLWNKLKLLELLEQNKNDATLEAISVLARDEEVMVKHRANLILAAGNKNNEIN